MKKVVYALVCVALSGALARPALAQQTVQDLQFMLQGGSYLGIGVREVDSARVQALKLKEERGVEVTSIEQGSPAEMAGIKVGDVVLEFSGEQVQATGQFVRLVREIPAGRKVKMQVWRNGGTVTLTATLGTRKPAISQNMPRIEVPQFNVPQFNMPDLPSPKTSWRVSGLGVEAEAIDGQIARYFGVNAGVLVRNVSEGSPAEKAGLKAGDVITKVGATDVDAPREVSRLLRELEGRPAQITAVREHKEMTISLQLNPEPARGGNRYSKLEIVGE